MSTLKYQSGFGNQFSTEALPDALPQGQNSPQQCPYGLYAEQISGTSFTTQRHKNLRSWMYRIRPSVCQTSYMELTCRSHATTFQFIINPNQLRWNPIPLLNSDSKSSKVTPPVDFVDGLMHLCSSGSSSSSSNNGVNIFNYTCNTPMTRANRSFQNSDGDFLIVPQHGSLLITTEMGILAVDPCEIVVLPRGIKFSVDVSEPSRGYILEVLDGHFELPSLGPIGANGLANARDFQVPVAAYVDEDVHYCVVNKFMGSFFQSTLPYSPYNVVAWFGNYTPFKYDLRKFNAMNTVTFDHADPSIFTVLTCPNPSNGEGTALADFVIFPPRWMVAEHTFRPPYYHRNCMTEYMGMIYGEYDGKGAGFGPGGASLHSCMTAHGPDAQTFTKATSAVLSPVKFSGGLAFMFETCRMLMVHPAALNVAAQPDGSEVVLAHEVEIQREPITKRHRTGSLIESQTESICVAGSETVKAQQQTLPMFPSLQGDYLRSWNTLPKLFNGVKHST